MNQFDRQRDIFIRYQHHPDDPTSLSYNDVTNIYEDHAGWLWIGTFGGGLNRFDRASGIFTCFGTEHGLPNNIIYGIMEDDDDNLWISTNQGVSKFDPKTGVFKNYDQRDGLQGNEFNDGAHFKSDSGEMFFGGINGFNAFYPQAVTDNPYVPPVVITSFKVFNRDVLLPAPIAEMRELRLSYKDSFAFEFAALSFSNPRKNRYAYKLSGVHKEWIYLGNKHEITFASLDPGQYTLRIKAANNDGVWNEEGISLGITITPPYWRTWWFMSLSVLLVAGLGIRWHRRRLKWKQLLLDNESDMDYFFKKYKITRREQEIVNLILRGKDNREIENKLFISLGTVKNHIHNIFQKVGVNNRGQLILKVVNSPKKRIMIGR